MDIQPYDIVVIQDPADSGVVYHATRNEDGKITVIQRPKRIPPGMLSEVGKVVGKMTPEEFEQFVTEINAKRPAQNQVDDSCVG